MTWSKLYNYFPPGNQKTKRLFPKQKNCCLSFLRKNKMSYYGNLKGMFLIRKYSRKLLHLSFKIKW